LKKEEFACEEEAEKAVQRWIKKHPRCLLESLDISTVFCRVNRKRGRPKKGKELKTSYVVNPKIIPNETFIQKEKEKLGKFIPTFRNFQIAKVRIYSALVIHPGSILQVALQPT